MSDRKIADFDSELWVITAYFNPQRYGNRLKNFRYFRKFLGHPLLVVELGFDQCFDLDGDDAEILVRRGSGDVLWQRERLLNLAVEHLPAHVKFVAWIDCDVAFSNSTWAEAAVAQLSNNAIVQLFEFSVDLAPNETHLDAAEESLVPRGRSIGMYVATGKPKQPKLVNPAMCGQAWAARRELLARHKYYDEMIVGGGDIAVAFAAFGDHESVLVRYGMSPRHAERYLDWAERFHDEVRGRVGYIEGNLFHYWHGAREDRLYKDRHFTLASFDFDPAVDIAVNGDGCFVWASDKPELHAFMHEYWKGRREDGGAAPSAAGA